MTRFLGTWMLRLGGWRIDGHVPANPKLVIAIAPHTSNWDFFWLLMAKWALALKPNWLGKHTLFSTPAGWFFRRIGGIPVDRGRRADVVSQAVAAFRQRDRMLLALAPEGTRGYTDHWKSGFYGIALEAGVPVLPVAIDYGRREIVLGGLITLTGDRHVDMNNLRAFFEGRRGRNPENQAPVRLKGD